ncbi:hypothetical protein Fmac_018300 [Flemingia macrophylla]|uniref:Uncharacterized protein n=1 Tax=Flemingia macrophylla TaxID=520843 RepID=A0ABD1M4L4_9FABA
MPFQQHDATNTNNTHNAYNGSNNIHPQSVTYNDYEVGVPTKRCIFLGRF